MPPAMTPSLNPHLMGVAPAVPAIGLATVPPSAWRQQLLSEWCWIAVAAMIDCVVPPAGRRSQCQIGNLSKTGVAHDAAATVDWCNPGTVQINVQGTIPIALGALGTIKRYTNPPYGRTNIFNWADIIAWVAVAGQFCPILIHFGGGQSNFVPHYILATGVQDGLLIVYDPAEYMQGSHRVELTESELRYYRNGAINRIFFV